MEAQEVCVCPLVELELLADHALELLLLVQLEVQEGLQQAWTERWVLVGACQRGLQAVWALVQTMLAPCQRVLRW